MVEPIPPKAEPFSASLSNHQLCTTCPVSAIERRRLQRLEEESVVRNQRIPLIPQFLQKRLRDVSIYSIYISSFVYY